jgi:CheY-like chemotaxis protein
MTKAAQKRVLIVDDEAGLRRSLHARLLASGYDADEAIDGLSALDRIHHSYRDIKPYSHVITNALLPDIEGAKLLEVIKARFPSLPVIMTGYGSAEVVCDRTTLARAAGYVERPVDLDALDELLGEPAAVDKRPVPQGEQVAATGYALLQLPSQSSQLQPSPPTRAGVFHRLYGLEHVAYCDAVRGGYDLVLLLFGQDAAQLENVRHQIGELIRGVTLDYLPIVRSALPFGVQQFLSDYQRQLLRYQDLDQVGSGQLLAYVLCEVSREHLSAAIAVLWFKDNVVACDATRGEYDLVLLIRARSYRELETIAHQQVRPVRGVLRARLVPVIDLFQM